MTTRAVRTTHDFSSHHSQGQSSPNCAEVPARTACQVIRRPFIQSPPPARGAMATMLAVGGLPAREPAPAPARLTRRRPKKDDAYRADRLRAALPLHTTNIIARDGWIWILRSPSGARPIAAAERTRNCAPGRPAPRIVQQFFRARSHDVERHMEKGDP